VNFQSEAGYYALAIPAKILGFNYTKYPKKPQLALGDCSEYQQSIR
jgi:hypothetical protein